MISHLRTLLPARRGVLRHAALTSCFATGALLSPAVTLGDVQIGGFVSQGWLQSWGNNYPVEALDGTFDFREIGLNASYSRGALRVGAQVFAQSLGNYGDDEPLLDWAVVDYNVRREFGVRAGRLKYPKGLYGEALDVDAIRPFIFLPSGIYSAVMRDFNSSFDGATLYGNVALGDQGSVDYKVFYGDIGMSPDQGVADFFNSASLFAPPGVRKVGIDSLAGAQLMWNTPVNGLRFGYSYSHLDGLYGSGPFAYFPTASANISSDLVRYHTGSVEYFVGDWMLAAEFQTINGDFDINNPFSTARSVMDWTNWYVSAARRLTDRIEVGAYYSAQANNRLSPGNPAHAAYLREWVTSIRFDLTERLLVKVEGHWIKGTMNMFDTQRTPNPALDDRTTFVAIRSTYSF